MNHQKEDVYREAQGLEVEILLALTDMNKGIFDHRKEHPCPDCGGETRFRYRKEKAGRLDRPFHCNYCGGRNWIELLMATTKMSFSEVINAAGDYLNLIPVEKRETINKHARYYSSFPAYYSFDIDRYEKLKSEVKIALSPWQRVSGLNMLDILAHGENALIPLLDRNGNAVDFTMIDVDGNWQTTAGNKTVPVGFYSVFGESEGNRTYIAVNPYHTAHASIYTGKKIVCCYEVENLDAVANNFEGEIVVIVSSVTETQEADTLKLPQLTFNKQNNTVNRRLWQPFEIMDKRNCQ